uniref:SGNH hydrolase-type esterase domain-containing protein n=1 Tax=Fagus sylvatica TaxID=28930 RepID=A0A2N9H015_FAGSY
MATTNSVLSLLLTLIAFSLLLFPRCIGAHPLKVCMFDAIYQLGDSISDTGNLIRENPAVAFARLPYGETSFKKATGRCSNGLLMIDYIALSAGIPFLSPYLDKDALFVRGCGENFAVAGSTALPAQILAEKNISSPVTNSSLNVQLDWMSTHFNDICYNADDCIKKLQTALFMVGEVGWNDYNYALFQGKTIEDVRNMVPEVVQAIKEAVTRVIGFGAARVVVPGNFPIGCSPIYLTAFQTNNSAAYDEFHCLLGLNDLSMYHNYQLKQAIKDLRKENPNAIIVYGDYYNAFQWVHHHAPLLGFDAASTQKSCCGNGGDYEFSLEKMCGAPGVPVCPNPDERISWDGVHLTQKAYRYMANWLIYDILPKLLCKV